MMLLNIELKNLEGFCQERRKYYLQWGNYYRSVLIDFQKKRLLLFLRRTLVAYIILRNYGILTNLVDDLMMVLEKLKHRKKR